MPKGIMIVSDLKELEYNPLLHALKMENTKIKAKREMRDFPQIVSYMGKSICNAYFETKSQVEW